MISLTRFPDGKYEQETAERLQAQSWQLEMLKRNPGYTGWGNGQDYMTEREDKGWATSQRVGTWAERWELDDLNELAHAYFYVWRPSEHCNACDGSGLNPATKRLDDDWYDFAGTGRKWGHKLTDVEVLALAKAGRLDRELRPNQSRYWYDNDQQTWITVQDGQRVPCEMPVLPSADTVNAFYSRGIGLGHDAINKWVCVEARARHLGVYGKCDPCLGSGDIVGTAPAQLALQLWLLHPRKGCSRGLVIEQITREDLPSVAEFFQQARQRFLEKMDGLIAAGGN